MAAGTAGVKQNKGENKASANQGTNWRQSNLDANLPKESKGFWAVQCEALKDIFTEKLNVTAFLFVPLGQYCKYAGMSPGLIFLTNFLAIVPLASILGQST